MFMLIAFLLPIDIPNEKFHRINSLPTKEYNPPCKKYLYLL